MGAPLSYVKAGSVTRIVMDDGKVNVMSSTMLSALLSAFDRAEQDAAVVLLSSARAGIFSAGFDTKILASKQPEAIHTMVKLGAELAARILSFRYPVVAACNGHAFPMGAFLLLASDVRIGVDGPFKIGMNEVAIGIPVPLFAMELGHHRMVPAYLQRTALSGEMFAPQEALTAGFLDHVVALDALPVAAESAATALCKIDFDAHASTKTRLRRAAIAAVRAAIEEEITLAAYERRAATSSGG